MSGRWAGLCVVALLLSGCVTDKVGLDYASTVQKMGPPRAGQSRIVMVAEQKKALVQGTICDVKLDGATVGSLKIGTYLYVDRPAGHHQLGATQTLFPGETKSEITTQAGRVHFFLVQASQRSKGL